MKKTVHILKVVCTFWIIVFIYSALVNFGFPYVSDAFHFHLTSLAEGFVKTTLTIILFFLTIWLISLGGASRRLEFLTTIIDAMKRISTGDFNVQLNHQFGHAKNHPFEKFVEGINDMAVELKELEEMRQEFISNVSHEIQSPLASISGFARVLKRSELAPEDRAHYLNIIETESLRLAHLSDNLLKLTSMESDRYPFDMKTYRLDQQIRKVILSCEPQWLAKTLQLDISLDEFDVRADEELMDQVWLNLITNSIKFTPDGGTLAVTLRKQNESAVVTIADTGIGISLEHQEHIFERFYKADPSRNRALGGSGLGLSIVKKIIDMHEGSIEVESENDEGTMFKIHLPISNEQLENKVGSQ
ncbi:two-component sensor histidine kinase [Sporosarcina sp. BI001-red]|uniref:sensor histidine kinase n=1 Tax=Sporosarcina sp. BI001-red TaxID=2282866 RepID=UPI000E288A86|nr:HAMP domain-containing sensor histidine kinase [Sporosarcina sp. BI001-red]REB05285.1 two-component sensor histidine kinase [Sporosarcina sp. BI001-red]